MFGFIHSRQLPNRVLVLSSMPSSKKGFMNLAESGCSDFYTSMGRQFNEKNPDVLWSKYKGCADALSRLKNLVAKRGGVFVQDFSVKDLQKANDYDVVIIIAHHSDDSDEIELSGGMVGTKQLVNAIPLGTQTVFDVTSCYSSYLIPKLKARLPESRIIGISSATSLALRLYVLEKVINVLSSRSETNYLDALRTVISSLPREYGIPRDFNPAIYLGGKQQSSVFSPKEAIPGEDFIVSIFIHRDKDAQRAEIEAKMMDDSIEKRGSKSLSFPLRDGDVLEFQLSCPHLKKGEFSIDKNRKKVIWDGDICSVEFVVSVSPDCSISAFVGKIKICVNKIPAGDMVFKTQIVQRKEGRTSQDSAPFTFSPYNQQEEMSLAKKELLEKLDERINELRQAPDKNREELEICVRCRELLSSPVSKGKNRVFQVFVSSTSDMANYRKIIKERVEACEMYPDMYENWGQGTAYPRDVCCQHVLNSDIFVCILGPKYGFIEPIWNKSMTEIEYRVAQQAGIPILVYIPDKYEESIKQLPEDERKKSIRQNHLIEEIKNSRMVGMFPNELGLSLLANAELLTLKHELQS